MVLRILAIAFIFGCTSVAWIILGATIFSRTYSADAGLKGRVVSTWGAPHEQRPPSATFTVPVTRTLERREDGKRVTETVTDNVTHILPLEASALQVRLDLDHRQKGLLWYSTYRVAFTGDYTFRNNTDAEREVTFALPFPAEKAVYDDLQFAINGVPADPVNQQKSAFTVRRVSPNQTAVLRVTYRSQGLDTWRYQLGSDVAQARNFNLRVSTNFKEVDFAENTLSPTEKQRTAEGWQLTWNYHNLVSGFQIGVAMPEKLQPGPLAGQISYFAPVSLLFFFFVILMVTALRGIDLHPMNYFFLAAAFFAFHLLLAYLADQISIHAAFLISSAVSVFLLVSYLRVVVGERFAYFEAGAAQFVFLVLFSYAFFFKGLTGLAVTIGAVLTLFVAMQMTARVRWSERFASAPQAQA